MNALHVRRAAPQDYDAVRDLLQRYFREGAVDVDEAYEDTRLRSALADTQLGFSVAEECSALVACVLNRALASVPSACECKRLYVLPSARGRGIAHSLMEFIEQQSRLAGYEWMYLDSKDNFTGAIAMYRKLGYEPCERYNDNPQATVFFRKRLTPQPA